MKPEQRAVALAWIVAFIVALVIVLFPLKSQAATVPHFSLSGEINIETAEKFKRFIISNSKKVSPKIIVHIESLGGYVISENKILHYLMGTESKVLCYVDSHAASAAANILTYCAQKGKVYVTPKAMIMFHISQVCKNINVRGECTKYVPVTPVSHPKEYKKSIKSMKHVKNYLTPKQWKAILKGKDVEITGAQFMAYERLRLSGVK